MTRRSTIAERAHPLMVATLAQTTVVAATGAAIAARFSSTNGPRFRCRPHYRGARALAGIVCRGSALPLGGGVGW
jgi:hypothetical protein